MKQKKSDLIREYLSKHPKASAKEVVESLGAAGVKVTPSQVYGLRASKPKRVKANGYEPLIQAKKFADAMGGVEPAREALAALSKLL